MLSIYFSWDQQTQVLVSLERTKRAEIQKQEQEGYANVVRRIFPSLIADKVLVIRFAVTVRVTLTD